MTIIGKRSPGTETSTTARDTLLGWSRYNTFVEVEGRHFVYNGLAGHFRELVCDHKARLDDFLSGTGGLDGLADELEVLVRNRMVVPNTFDELDFLRMRYQRSRNGNGTLGLTILTSLGCNFDCPYCYEDKTPALLSDGVAGHILRLVDDSLPNMSRLDVTWFGGEPLLGKDQLLRLSDQFIARCEENDVDYSASIITNGWHLTKDTVRELADRHVVHAQVTLDGPPDIHEKYRPVKGGGRSFQRIVDNLQAAADAFDVHVRVNVDAGNLGYSEELVQILAAEGFAGRLIIYPGRIINETDVAAAPAATYSGACFSGEDFSEIEIEFFAMVERYGFRSRALPQPIATPCVAVRATDLIIGAKGELWKCWDNVGDEASIIGNIESYEVINSGLDKWLEYDPFQDEECVDCVALPVCMGGCAHHSFASEDRSARCVSFRHNGVDRVVDTARRTLGLPGLNAEGTPIIDSFRPLSGDSWVTATPVALTTKP